MQIFKNCLPLCASVFWLLEPTTRAFAAHVSVARDTDPAQGQWPASKAMEWYNRKPWLVGCNFLPSSAVNDVEMWQKDTFDPETIDRELAWAQELGFNSVRVFLNFVVWQDDPAGFKKCFDQFLGIAYKRRLQVMPVLFDDCNFAGREAHAGPQPNPEPGVHNSQWVSSPPLKMVTNVAANADLEKYVKDVVSTFRRDRRVLLWDLYNEPGNSGLGNNSLPLVEATFSWARSCRPTQPLTTGVWGAPPEISRRQLELSDIISFHNYGSLPTLKSGMPNLRSFSRPIICTEWMARTLGSRFESHLPWFKSERIGCWNWGLVTGRIQTCFPWGSPKGAPMPDMWFHDILHADGAPFSAEEVRFIKDVTSVKATAVQEEPAQAARELTARLLPGRSSSFVFETIPADQGKDVFEIESRGRQIVLRGNNGVAMASALNWYLKYYCQCHYSLKAQQLNLPHQLPAVHPKVRRVSQDRWRYFLNYCCFGYSLPWYNWPQWERLIDWMALNGVNTPLSVTGQEAVWLAAGRELGFSDADMQAFFAGPPYLPFGWMGCLDGWGGPLPKRWIEQHTELQQKILARERALGMTPVLQGFTGHVPPTTRQRFPNARLHTVHWIEWDTVLLDPLDPLFRKFSRTLLNHQNRLFGTDHLYAADTFIEMTPPSGDTNFLAATGRAIYQGMAEADPQAVWVLQGWTFFNQAQFWTQPRIEAFLGAVPNSQMLVLDLFCDVTPVWNKTRAFYGKPWVWCALQNFGDCVYLGGALNRIHADLPAARRDSLAVNLSGIGFVNEGLDYNPIIFDFLFEQAWRPEPVNLDSWVRDYAHRAHGAVNSDSEAAWTILQKTVYTGQHQFAPAYTRSPSLRPAGDPPHNNEQLMEAWQNLLNAAPATHKSDAYLFDLASVTRQVLGNHSGNLHRQVVEGWRAKDRLQFQTASQQMLDLIRDLDELLATRSEYLLGRWLQDARRWGASAREKDRLEWNARRVLTMWGDSTQIRDYSRRQWSGMLSGFYLKRWEQFFAVLDSAFAKGSHLDEAAFDRNLQSWERQWADQHESYPRRPRGDTLAVSRRLWKKYQEPLRQLRQHRPP